ncbi:MAG TPA: trehalose-phosphatase [Thermoanaerobaculia bacterium]|nr:trehalose-phosphatase [Thermoanaerobaculia bacterium]
MSPPKSDDSGEARPSALECWNEIADRLAGSKPAVFLDYDGTLSPIAPRPELATLPLATREVLQHLALHLPVAILSGRGLEDVTALVGISSIIYAGSHGFDISGPPLAEGGPPLRYEVGEGIPERIERAAARLRRELQGIEGVLVEPKRFSVAVHFRLADEAALPRIEQAVDATLADAADAADIAGLRKAHGKKVFELRPDLDWDKGKALLWLLEMRLDHAANPVVPLYIGDDVTDEDAFRVLEERGIGILVAEEPRPTAAAYSLRDPDEVRQLLERLADCTKS